MKQLANANKEIAATVAPGVKRRLLAHGGGLMMAYFTFSEGASINWHSHPHEQVSYVVLGEGELWVEGLDDPVRLVPGGSYYIPPNVRHRLVANTEAVFLDVFTPQREDFVT
jgi:quercetin dioxygenase-like cupin family protein